MALKRKAWPEHSMASVNQTRPYCVNQTRKTNSKPSAARHGCGMLQADSHIACRSHAAPMPCVHSHIACRSPAMPCVNSHMPCRALALLLQCRVLRECPHGSRKYPNCQSNTIIDRLFCSVLLPLFSSSMINGVWFHTGHLHLRLVCV